MWFRNIWRSNTKPTWKDVERFDESWKKRISSMAAHINAADGPVLDIGCGPMWLRQFLPAEVQYIGLDYVSRGEGSIVCDLNSGRIPPTGASTFFISGCLEYVVNVDAFVADVAGMAKRCIVSYCALDDFPSLSDREKQGWKNNLTIEQLIALFTKYGMQNQHLSYTETRNAVMVFDHRLPPQLTA